MADARSLPYPLGFSLIDGRYNFAVYSETADAVFFCVFDEDGDENRVELAERTGHVFHGFVDGVGVGTRYGIRVDGAWDPEAGLRHNVDKLLLDPHATAIEGGYDWGPTASRSSATTSNEPQTAMNDSDSAPFMPALRRHRPTRSTGRATGARCTPLDETVIYETHVKGFTKLHPDVPEEIRGTYAGLAHPAAIKHLTDLGVTRVELLPVHQFVQDSHLGEKGLRNYWGYNSHRVLRPAQRVQLGRGPGRRAGRRVQGDGQGAARRRARGDPRRGLQPHRRGQRHRARPCRSRASTTRRTTASSRATRAHYFDTTGTGNSLNVGAPGRARPDHGQPALLGHRDARRRLPLRPRHDAHPAGRRRRDPQRLPRPDRTRTRCWRR